MVSLLDEAPALAERRFDVLVGLGVVGEPHLRVIPLEFAFATQRDSSQREPFGERARDGEVRTRRRAALTGADPVEVMLRSAREQLGWKLVRLMAGHGKQADTGAVRIAGHEPFATDEDGAFGDSKTASGGWTAASRGWS